MTDAQRNQRALIVLAAGLVAAAVAHYGFSPGVSGVSSIADNPAVAEQRLVRLRQIAATIPEHEAIGKRAAADTADREKGMLQADTAAQGQAALLEIASRLGKEEQLDVRGGEFGAPKAFGDYGLVYATITFDCHIEQLVNFLADLARQPELIAPSEERLTVANPKDKIMNARIVLAGVVPKKLVPEKKGLAAF